MKPVSAETAEHYTWGEACDGWHLVKADSLSVIEERMPPGTMEQRHRHHHARQFFYVLSGQLTIEVEGAVHPLAAGCGLEVAPQMAHQVLNLSSESAQFLVVSTPPAQGDRQSV